MVTSGTQTKGNVDIPCSLLTHSQEEADTLLVLHAVNVPNDAELVVSSPDTDLLLLLVYMYPSLPICTSTTFLTGKGRLKRNISVQSIYSNLGPKRASALLGFHALTGSDMSGKFAGRTKDSCFKAFMSCDDEILDALEMLGSDNDLPTDACSQLERFVCVFCIGPKPTQKLMSSVGSTTPIVQPKEKTSHQLLVRWTCTFNGHTTYP